MWRRLGCFLEMIKFEHTIFALPFAYIGWLFAQKIGDGSGFLLDATSGKNPEPSPFSLDWRAFGWITVGMVGARTFGMTWNRIVDRPLDTLNSRTQAWPSVTGAISLRACLAACVAALAALTLAAWQLNPLCLILTPVALALLIGYPFTKRFTWLSHFWLGAVLACAPLAGWIGVTGHWSPTPLCLAIFVMLWVAGFDILYALLDVDFDRRHQLASIPAQFGVSAALLASFASHLAAVGALAGFGRAMGVGVWYWTGVAAIAAVLVAEHLVVRPGDPKRILTAFFPMNSAVSVGLLVVSVMELMARRG